MPDECPDQNPVSLPSRRAFFSSIDASMERSPFQLKWTGGVAGSNLCSVEKYPTIFCHFNLTLFDRGE
jgi:hypothetical protein